MKLTRNSERSDQRRKPRFPRLEVLQRRRRDDRYFLQEGDTGYHLPHRIR